VADQNVKEILRKIVQAQKKSQVSAKTIKAVLEAEKASEVAQS